MNRIFGPMTADEQDALQCLTDVVEMQWEEWETGGKSYRSAYDSDEVGGGFEQAYQDYLAYGRGEELNRDFDEFEFDWSVAYPLLKIAEVYLNYDIKSFLEQELG